MAEAAPKLDEAALQAEIQNLDNWKLEDGEIIRVFRFADFVAAMKFVNKAAELAESAGHHPDIAIRYNRVRMALVTHDSGGVTANDITMAKRLNEIFKS